MKKLILKVKFGHKKDVVPFLAQRLALLVQTNAILSKYLQTSFEEAKSPLPPFTKGGVYVSYIPSHRRRRYLEKGYNQSELLAKALAKELGLSMLSLAKKQRYTLSQLKLSRDQRAKNLKNAFVAQHLDLLPK